MWITLTSTDLEGYLSGPEMSALPNAAKAAGQTAAGIIAEALSNAVLQVRGFVSGCKTNKLGADGTIPNELKDASLCLARAIIYGRLPGMKSLNDETRQQQHRDAMDLLKATSKCEFGIVPPEEAAADQPAGTGVEQVSSRPRVAKRSDLNGLL
jgi:hypothetical protein